MSIYTSAVKLFVAGAISQTVERMLQDAKSISAYRILPIGEDDQHISVRLVGSGNDDKPAPVTAPPSGVILILKGEGGAAEVENFEKLWDEAGIKLPEKFELTGADGDIGQVLERLIHNMSNEVRSACQRNVDLRSQIAVLREEIEQANIQLRELHGVVAARDGGAHTLLHSATATEGFISLNAGQVLRQRLPLTVHAWSLGALALLASAASPMEVRIRLIAAEDDTVLKEWRISIEGGAAWQFVRLSQRIPNRYQLIHLELERTDSDPASLELGIARSFSPDEELAINGENLSHTLAVQLWGGGAVEDDGLSSSAYVASHVFENFIGARLEEAPLDWIVKAEPLSKITRPPKWFGQFNNYLRVHPSVGIVAAASVPLEHEIAFDGAAIDFLVPDVEGKIVQFCIAAIDYQSEIPPVQELADFAENNGRAKMDGSVMTTNWISTVPGGIMKTVPIFFDEPKNKMKLVLMTRVNGNTAGNCNSNFKKLRYIYKIRK